MIEQISHDDTLLAIIVRSSFKQDGIQFFTPNDMSQQLAYMSHPAGKRIEPHVHNPTEREVRLTQEVLLIKSGQLRVDFYNQDRRYLESRILTTGDVILLASGGHGFEVLEPVEMFEVKQGPYTGDADKTRFEAIDNEHIILKGPAGE